MLFPNALTTSTAIKVCRRPKFQLRWKWRQVFSLTKFCGLANKAWRTKITRDRSYWYLVTAVVLCRASSSTVVVLCAVSSWRFLQYEAAVMSFCEAGLQPHPKPFVPWRNGSYLIFKQALNAVHKRLSGHFVSLLLEHRHLDHWSFCHEMPGMYFFMDAKRTRHCNYWSVSHGSQISSQSESLVPASQLFICQKLLVKWSIMAGWSTTSPTSSSVIQWQNARMKGIGLWRYSYISHVKPPFCTAHSWVYRVTHTGAPGVSWVLAAWHAGCRKILPRWWGNDCTACCL